MTGIWTLPRKIGRARPAKTERKRNFDPEQLISHQPQTGQSLENPTLGRILAAVQQIAMNLLHFLHI
ncbi:hypothetical protein [Martelella alba]|uniref:hypothetical protein n=1 Tax=Martelella alba TaxID=2590451 RepID=UPI0015E86502|nr:hypothetical protein [Martelella alba]